MELLVTIIDFFIIKTRKETFQIFKSFSFERFINIL